MGFSGFRSDLEYESKDLNLHCEVRFRKVDVVDLTASLNIVAKSKDTGKVVKRTPVNQLTGEKVVLGYRFLDSDGNEVPKDRVSWFVVKDNQEIEVKPYKRTSDIVIKQEIPAEREFEFLVEGIYELFSEKNPETLYKLAKKLEENKTIGVSSFSFGNGFRKSICLLKPIILSDGRFIFQMILTQKKAEYRNFMSLREIKKEEIIPTLETVLGELKI